MREASIAFYIFVLAGLHESVKSDNETETYVTVSTLKIIPVIKPPMPFKYGKSSLITFNYSIVEHNVTKYPKKGFIITVSVDNGKVATIQGQGTYYIDYSKPRGNISIKVTGANAGRSQLRFRIQDWMVIPVAESGLFPDKPPTEKGMYTDVAFPMFVTMTKRPIDTLFNAVVFLLVMTTNIGMGTQVDLEIVKSQLRRPVAAGIGLFSQFVFMPLIAFSVAVGLEPEPGIALGLFACGCAPGGMASNIFTYLLRGNVSLSITMTLVSTLASLGMLPLWLFTLGAYLYRKSDIKIPFLNIFISLFIIIIPTVIGLVIQKETPGFAALVIKSTKCIMAFFIAFMFTVGTYANWWVLDLVDSKVLLASAALPYLGFLLGGLAAYAGKQVYSDIVTIAVETGIQNTAVPLVLLHMSLTGPEQATSMVVPLISATLTPIPFVFAVTYLEIKDCIQIKRRKTVPEAEEPVDAGSREEGEDNVENTGKMLSYSENPEKHFSYYENTERSLSHSEIREDPINFSRTIRNTLSYSGDTRESFGCFRNEGTSAAYSTPVSRKDSPKSGKSSFLEPGESRV